MAGLLMIALLVGTSAWAQDGAIPLREPVCGHHADPRGYSLDLPKGVCGYRYLHGLRVVVSSDGDAVEIEISDSGPGISPADKERLFLPQFSTKDRGTGLGLAIASRIVAEHNGAIRVEDNQPAGSRFVIRFPALEVAASTRAAN